MRRVCKPFRALSWGVAWETRAPPDVHVCALLDEWRRCEPHGDSPQPFIDVMFRQSACKVEVLLLSRTWLRVCDTAPCSQRHRQRYARLFSPMAARGHRVAVSGARGHGGPARLPERTEHRQACAPGGPHGGSHTPRCTIHPREGGRAPGIPPTTSSRGPGRAMDGPHG